MNAEKEFIKKLKNINNPEKKEKLLETYLLKFSKDILKIKKILNT